MIPLGLTAAQRQLFEQQLVMPHKMRAVVRLQNLDGDDLSELTSRLLDGQVNIDTTAETTRQCSVTIDDPNRALHFDSDAPGDGALYVDRMLRIDYGVYVDALSAWVDVPIFCGPVVSMSRNGTDVELSCLGKEYLAKGNAWRPLTLKKGMDTCAAIKTILRDRAGESRFDFPDINRKLPKTLSLGRMTQPWALASRLARSIDRQLYYDGRGICRLRAYPRGVVFTFRDGVRGSVLSDASLTFDVGSVRNLVWVVGGKPKGAKNPVTANVVAARSHPLSPWRLGRSSAPRFLVERIDNDHVRTKKRATAIARRRLRQTLIEGVDVSFDALPIPHLDPGDVVRLSTELTSVTFALKQASIPLTHDGSMSIGINKRVTINKQAIR